jgi:hypothetical protein
MKNPKIDNNGLPLSKKSKCGTKDCNQNLLDYDNIYVVTIAGLKSDSVLVCGHCIGSPTITN